MPTLQELATDINNYNLANDCTGDPTGFCYSRCILRGYDQTLDCVPHGCYEPCPPPGACPPTLSNASEQAVSPACYVDLT